MSTNYKKVELQVREKTPVGIIEKIADQMDRAAEAASRINEEGVVVRDLKGSVIAHPAIKVEADATKIICDLLGKWMKINK